MKKSCSKLIYFLLLTLMILYVLHVFPIKLSKEMNIVFAHAQITYKQPVWGIICKAGVVRRILTGVYYSVGRNGRTRTSYISYPIKDNISILGSVGSTGSRSSLCISRIIIFFFTLHEQYWAVFLHDCCRDAQRCFLTL